MVRSSFLIPSDRDALVYSPIVIPLGTCTVVEFVLWRCPRFKESATVQAKVGDNGGELWCRAVGLLYPPRPSSFPGQIIPARVLTALESNYGRLGLGLEGLRV